MTILTDIKNAIGIVGDNLGFDSELLGHVNSVRATLVQFGVTEFESAPIDTLDNWPQFGNETIASLVKEYFNLKTKKLFDPIPSATILESMNNSLTELEGRILFEVEQVAANA